MCSRPSREELVDDVLNKLQVATAYSIEPLLTQLEVSQYHDISYIGYVIGKMTLR